MAAGEVGWVITCRPGIDPASGNVRVGASSPYCIADAKVGALIATQAYILDPSFAPQSGSAGDSELNVSADIFVGVALVLCLAVGWIAGAQR